MNVPAKDNTSCNKLIHGDNLIALKSLEQEYSGKVKCVFIDPPYNIGKSFLHYDDKKPHSLWLDFMRARLEIIYTLMAADGSLWITIDDNECHYLKVLCDDIFGRNNFVANVVWQKKSNPQNNSRLLGTIHDHILVYAKYKKKWKIINLPRTEKMNSRYKNPNNDPRGEWYADDLSAISYSSSTDYPITLPSGRVVNPPPGRCWIVKQKKFMSMIEDNRIYFGKNGDGGPMQKKFFSEVRQHKVSSTIWSPEESGDNRSAKNEAKSFNTSEVFSTPKPEKLLHRILTLATQPGDLVLDCFAGSGTTGAVAHKMGRQWIMIELGNHCNTHIIPRLQKVIDGDDKGGVTSITNWEGGGGFTYYSPPSCIEFNHIPQKQER